MTKHWNRNVTVTLAMTTIALAMPSSASAEELLISGGSRGGSYEKWARNLSAQMKGLGHTPEVLASGGGKDNVERVKTGEAQVGFAQGDNLMALGGDGIEIIGSLGKECVFVAVADGGKVDDEDDLQDKGHKIAVGSKGSGSQVTWGYMAKLEPAYAVTAAVFKGGVRALGQLKSGQVDAVMWVTSPENLKHKLIATVNNDEALEFIDVDDSDLNDKLPDGTAVYTFEDIDTKKGFGGGIETICTPVLVIASADLGDQVLEDLAEQVISNAAALKQ